MFHFIYKYFSIIVLAFLFGVYFFPTPLSKENETFIQEKYDEYKKELNLKEHIIFIDFRKGYLQKRLFIYNISNQRLVYRSHVAHARKSGWWKPYTFSNTPESLYSSYGDFITAEKFESQFGKGIYKIGMRIKGLEKDINDNVYTRNIVFHPSNNLWSNGCFSSKPKSNKKVIELTYNGCLMLVRK